MNRRDFLLLSSAIALTAACQKSDSDQTDADGPRVADTLLYAYAPFIFARTCQRFISEWSGGAFNALGHRDGLMTPASRIVTMPNNDTLYSTAVLDLSAGPVELLVPDNFDRYWSISVLDPFTDTFVYLGTRATEGRGGRYWLTGPEWSGDIPYGVEQIACTYNDNWLLYRVVVDGPEDLETARRYQRDIILNALSDTPGRPYQTAAKDEIDAANMITVVNELLARSPLAGEALRAKQHRANGIDPGNLSAFSELPLLKRKAMGVVAGEATKRLNAAMNGTDNLEHGWRESPEILGRFGENDAVRAAVSLIGLGGMVREEAIYFSGMEDSSGASLDGENTYRLHIRPEGVPAKAFWSLSMYEEAPDGRFFFIENPIDRYAIGDRTAGLTANQDGSIDLLISHEVPEDTSNWLPAPNGPFRVTFRVYLPDDAVLNRDWRPNGIERLS